MKVYIASSHKISYKFTQRLVFELQMCPFEVFYPESIGIFANTDSEMNEVNRICCYHIKSSNVLVAIYPFGLSVATEIGRFLDQQEKMGLPIRFVIYDTSRKNSKKAKKLRTEAMIMPYVENIVNNISELICYLMNVYETEDDWGTDVV